MKKRIITMFACSIIAVSSLIGCTSEGIDPSNLLNEIKFASESNEEHTSLNDSIEELVAEIKIEDASEDAYDRDEYTSSTQYYVGTNGDEYTSIRSYAYYESTWYDENTDSYTCPYTGEEIDSVKSTDYDHIIPLHYANQHGASEWTEEEKRNFADDPFIGVDSNASDNRAKGDKGPSEWMPEENQEEYAYTWLVIAAEYDLSIAQEDMDVIMDTLDGIDEVSVINQYR